MTGLGRTPAASPDDREQGVELSRASMMIDLGRYGDAARLLAPCSPAARPAAAAGACYPARTWATGARRGRQLPPAGRAHSIRPDDWPYRLASTALISLDRCRRCVAAAQEARRLAPHFWRSHVCLAQAATADGQLELAAQAARAALALAPEQADVHVTAGKVALSSRGRG